MSNKRGGKLYQNRRILVPNLQVSKYILGTSDSQRHQAAKYGACTLTLPMHKAHCPVVFATSSGTLSLALQAIESSHEAAFLKMANPRQPRRTERRKVIPRKSKPRRGAHFLPAGLSCSRLSDWQVRGHLHSSVLESNPMAQEFTAGHFFASRRAALRCCLMRTGSTHTPTLSEAEYMAAGMEVNSRSWARRGQIAIQFTGMRPCRFDPVPGLERVATS